MDMGYCPGINGSAKENVIPALLGGMEAQSPVGIGCQVGLSQSATSVESEGTSHCAMRISPPGVALL